MHSLRNRPKPDFTDSNADKFLKLAGLAGAILMIALPLYYYSRLPDTIPIHFGFSGEADGFGPKWMILPLPVIGLAIWVLLMWLSGRPQIFNYPVEITEENAQFQYIVGSRLVVILAVLIVYIFLGIEYTMIKSALNESSHLAKCAVLIGTIAICLLPLWYLFFPGKKGH